MKKLALIVALLIVGSGTAAVVANTQGGGKAKYTIKQIMKQAHKDGLMKKVAGGNASSEEKAKLLDLYLSLLDSKPPKGEAASWQAKSNMAIVAAARVVVGREGAESKLTAATACGGCHKAHK